jgi:hypothetical protein
VVSSGPRPPISATRTARAIPGWRASRHEDWSAGLTPSVGLYLDPHCM